MVVLDTQVWLWWNLGAGPLRETQRQTIADNEATGLGISAVSLWEVAKLVEYGRVELPMEVGLWFESVLRHPGISVFPLTPEIAVESTRLPGDFHSDPFDQIIVATARVHRCNLMTSDRQIISYPHVTTIG